MGTEGSSRRSDTKMNVFVCTASPDTYSFGCACVWLERILLISCAKRSGATCGIYGLHERGYKIVEGDMHTR